MDKSEKSQHIPPQETGNQLDTSDSVSLTSSNEAHVLFERAVQRLLHVNRWSEIAGPLSADFRLTDGEGRLIDGPAQPGHHFRIDIPGPGPVEGKGYDWVKVEALDDERNAGGDEESVTLRVRPSPDPETQSSDVAHFFKDYATSSFRVERKGNQVIASVHGRNEIPNVSVESGIDKIRNIAVASGAVAGMAVPQWKGLVHGLLKD